MTDEWGPWIEHDFSPCPCVGSYVRLQLNEPPAAHPTAMTRISDDTFEGIVAGDGWEWRGPNILLPTTYVIRYRIRRPRALIALIEMAATLPEREDA